MRLVPLSRRQPCLVAFSSRTIVRRLRQFARSHAAWTLAPLGLAGVLACGPAAHAGTVTWNGSGGDGSFLTAANWTGGVVPGANDDAVNNTTSLITYMSSLTTTINSLFSNGAFTLASGTLAGKTSSSSFQVNNTFTISGGTLSNFYVYSGSGGQGVKVTGTSALNTVTLYANLAVQSGTLTQTGGSVSNATTSVSPGATYTLASLASSGMSVGAFTNSGTFNVTDSNIYDNYGGSAATFTNNGAMTYTKVASSANANMQLNGTLTNNGSLSITGGAQVYGYGTSSNSGTISVSDPNSSFTTRAGFTNSGTINASNQSSVQFYETTAATSVANSAAGTINIGNKSGLTFEGDITGVNVCLFTNNGTINADPGTDYGGSITILDSLSFTNNGTIAVKNNGSFNADAKSVTNSGVMQFVGGSFVVGSYSVFNGSTYTPAPGLFTNAAGGTITFTQTGATAGFANLRLANNTTFLNNGTVTFNNTNALSIATSSGDMATFTNGATGVLNLASGDSLLLPNNAAFVNNGTLNFTGSIYLDPGQTSGVAPSFTNNATLTLTGSQGIQAYLGMFTNGANGTIVFSNPSYPYIQFSSGSTFANAGTITFPAKTSLSLASGATFSNTGTMTIGDGTSNGSANLSLSGPLTNAGTMTIKSNANLSYSGGIVNSGTMTYGLTNLTINSANPLNNTGTFVTTASNIQVATTLSNSGTFTLSTGATMNVGSNGAFSNTSTGTLNISGGTLYNYTTLTNPGTITVSPGGVLYTTGGITNNGTVSVQTGSTTGFYPAIQVSGGYFTNSASGTLSITGDGTSRNGTNYSGLVLNPGYSLTNAGSLTIANAATVSVLSNTSATSFTNTGALSLTSKGTFYVTGGSVNSGTINITGGATYLFSGTSVSASVAAATSVVNSGTINVGDASAYSSLNDFGYTLRNTGQITVTHSNAFFDYGGLLQNEGTYTQVSGGFYGALLNKATFTLSAGASTASDNPSNPVNITQAAGTLRIDGGALLTSGTPLVVTGGVLTGSGYIYGDVKNTGGTVRVGGTDGNLVIYAGSGWGTGSYTQTSGGTLLLTEAAPGTASNGKFQISGLATLDGVVALQSAAGYTPQSGDSFTIMTYGSRSGQFAGVVSPTSSLLMTVAYNDAAKTVTATLGGSTANTTYVAPNQTLGNDQSGTTLTVTPSSFSNAGTVAAANGANVTISPTGGQPSTNTGNVSVGGGSTATFSTGLTQTAGATNVNGTLSTGSGSLLLQGGTLTGNGTINGNVANSGGTMNPGNSPGAMTINGNYNQNGGTLTIELGGTTQGVTYDYLKVNGAATLSGALSIVEYNGFVPADGTAFDFFDYNSESGAFSSISVPSGFTYTMNYNRAAINGIPGARLTLNSIGGGAATPDASAWMLAGFGLPIVGAGLKRRRG